MPGGVSVHTPADRLSGGPRPRGEVLSGKCATGCDHPVMSRGEVADQDVEMHASRCRCAARRVIPGGAALKRKPLAMRGWLQRHPAWIPLYRCAAEQSGPQGRQGLRIGAVQHDLAYLPDHAVIVIAHEPMMTGQAPEVGTCASGR